MREAWAVKYRVAETMTSVCIQRIATATPPHDVHAAFIGLRIWDAPRPARPFRAHSHGRTCRVSDHRYSYVQAGGARKSPDSSRWRRSSFAQGQLSDYSEANGAVRRCLLRAFCGAPWIASLSTQRSGPVFGTLSSRAVQDCLLPDWTSPQSSILGSGSNHRTHDGRVYGVLCGHQWTQTGASHCAL